MNKKESQKRRAIKDDLSGRYNSNLLNKEERQRRVIARGEHSNHSHVLVGNVIFNSDNTFTVNDRAKIRHILESNWLEGQEVWTKEHQDIVLGKGTYKYIPQVEYDPYQEIIRQVQD